MTNALIPTPTLKQLTGICVHFNGAGEQLICDAGVRYNTVNRAQPDGSFVLDCQRNARSKALCGLACYLTAGEAHVARRELVSRARS